MTQTTPDLSLNGDDSSDDSQEREFASRGCCSCWNFSNYNSRRPEKWERISISDEDRGEQSIDRDWWDKCVNALKKAKEWSELVAGPNWKTFIRRFNKAAGRSKAGRFHYDPLSYALNFDEGPGQNVQFEDDRIYRDFSSRFTVIAGQTQSFPSKDGKLAT